LRKSPVQKPASPESEKESQALDTPKAADAKRAPKTPPPPPEKVDKAPRIDPKLGKASSRPVDPPPPAGSSSKTGIIGDTGTKTGIIGDSGQKTGIIGDTGAKTKAPGGFGTPATAEGKVGIKLKPEMRSVVQQLDSANSLEQVRAILKGKEFSEAELRELSLQLRNSPTEARLERLVATRQIKKGGGASQGTTSIEARKKALDAKLVQARSQREERAKQMLLEVKGRVPARAGMVRDRTHRATLGGRPPLADVPGRISSVSPSPAQIGSALTISGSEFGSAQGRVGIYVGSDLEYGDISSWTDSSITVTLTEEIAALVGESEKSGYAWVKPDGYNGGPSEEIRIRPDPASLTPSIDRLSDDTVEPYALLIIEGSNFLTESSGTVQLRLEEGETFDLAVTEWTDTYIAGNFEGITGVVGGAGLLTVRNHAGQEATRSVIFQPDLVTRTFRLATEGVHCELWGSDGPSPLCLAGKKETFGSHSLSVTDGWEIIEFYVEEVESSGWTGHNVTRAPLLDTTGVPFDFEVEIWAEMYSNLLVRAFAVGRGPAGVDLWPAYRY
jgi:hypothetical protein